MMFFRELATLRIRIPKLENEYNIELSDEAVPVFHATRKISFALHNELHTKELKSNSHKSKLAYRVGK